MAGDEGYDAELPVDMQQYIDFVSNCCFILVGFLFRRFGLIRKEHLPGIQVCVFTVCLPLLMVGVLWTAQLDRHVLRVLGFSALIQTLNIVIALVATRHANRNRRGFYLMVSTAGAMAYVYPVILRSERFGLAVVPIVVMWELGGNIMVAVLFHGYVAQMYAPKSEDAPTLLPGTPSGQHARELFSGHALPTGTEPAPQRLGITCEALPVEGHGTLDGVPSPPETPTDSKNLRSMSMRSLRSTRSSLDIVAKASAVSIKKLFGILVRTPLIWGLAIGLFLNLASVPYTALPGRALRAVSSAFPPLLYVLLGSTARFDLGFASYGAVFKSLCGRWAMNLLLILVVRYTIPLDPKTIDVITLCLVAPITTTFVMYSGQNGYRMDQVSMTKNISDVVSLVMLNLLSLFL